MIKADFHTHSSDSPDGGIRAYQYAEVLSSGLLDLIAVTDHNTIDTALALQREFPSKVIVGEEIMTRSGEIIGLYLKEKISPGLSVEETVKAIKEQGGLVYVPHPLETVRHGLAETTLTHLSDYIDIVEVCNGRAIFQNKGPQAATWARLHRKAAAAASDAHGVKGLGSTYTFLPEMPTQETLVSLLQRARLIMGRPPLQTLLYPKLHRVRKKVTRGNG